MTTVLSRTLNTGLNTTLQPTLRPLAHGHALQRTSLNHGNRPYSSQHHKSKSSGDREEEPELPKFSMKDLGATPAVKAVVYTSLAVIGTAETYTYGKWIYGKVYPPSAEEGKDIDD